MEVKQILKRLVEAPSVPGFEDEVRKVIAKEFKNLNLKVEVDVMGNVIGLKEGEDNPRIMIAAHMDQVGLMVTHIDDDGYLRFTAKGLDQRVLYGLQVIVHGEKEKVHGVIGAKPAHLAKGEEREKAVKIEDMAIDIGATSRDEVQKMGIKPGTVITPILALREMGNKDRIVSVGLDDKAGVAAMIKAMEILGGEKLPASVYAVATCQEEIGLRGAITATYKIKPHIGIAIDVTHAAAYNVEKKLVSGIELGKGPAIGIGPNFHPALWKLAEEICAEKGIPYQREPILGSSGTDAWVIQVTREGVATALISIPLRYMHSPGEVASLSDIENTAKLVAELIIKLSTTNWRNLLTRI
ncbi:MAG: M42 family peptidase [Candidatus Methanomethylicota archaeon]|uniref:M42 family peptidase n=1 Tax=Thermoproteota archaeon TaxID=2056631 RepID=A0A497F310_9CREN|nr:MAG: M42 family peptidase [Candidatus Verstraetearchaeota archaeon]